jgi:hypothetical protein
VQRNRASSELCLAPTEEASSAASLPSFVAITVVGRPNSFATADRAAFAILKSSLVGAIWLWAVGEPMNVIESSAKRIVADQEAVGIAPESNFLLSPVTSGSTC